MDKKNIIYKISNADGYFMLLKLLIIFFLPILFLSCEAPRSNPADPMNTDNSDNVLIEGTVQTLSLPYTPLQDVLVLWIPHNSAGVVKETDSRGYFVIPNIEAVNGILVFEKTGYIADTVIITWNSAKTIAKVVNLNKIPILDSINLNTIIINTEPGVLNSELNFTAKISDSDNDIDSVYVDIPGLKVRKGLEFNITSKIYQAAFTPDDMKIDDIEKAVGYDFNLYVKDIFSKTFFIGTERISRVIKDDVKLVFPAGNAVADSVPVFLWEAFTAGYDHSFTLEIYTNDIMKQLVRQVTNISPDSTSYRLQQPLASKEYSWVIWIVDNYNNKSMSVPATFVVN